MNSALSTKEFNQNRYFLLNNSCILRKGKQGYAVYEFVNGNLFSIDINTGKILETLEKGNTIQETAISLKLDTSEVFNIAYDAANNNIGGFYPIRPYIEKYKIGRPRDRSQEQMPVINALFIELPAECRLKCQFCESPILFRCAMCAKSSVNADVSLLSRALPRLLKLDIRRIIIHGGDPISDITQLSFIIQSCRKIGYEKDISIVSNGSLVNRCVLEVLKTYAVNLIVPILPVFDNSQSQLPAFSAEVSSMCSLLGVPLTVTNLMAEGELLSKKEEVIKMMKPKSILTSLILDKNKPGYQKNFDNLKSRVDASRYYNHIFHHPCLLGILAITAAGEMLPCPYLKKEVMGSIGDPDGITEIFQNHTINEYWGLNLGQIDHCCDCEYQLACLDCRAIESKLSENLYGKHICPYNKIPSQK